MTWWRRWLGRTISPADAARESWRKAWTEAAAQPHCGRVASLQTELEALALPEEEVELEREMLDGLRSAAALSGTLETIGLPTVETGHRAAGGVVCHFSAPASMPDDPAQPSGRLLLTATRGIFVGGSGPTIPWHAVSAVQAADRDVIVIRADRDTLVRFRFNSYADALCAVMLMRRLMPRRAGTL